MENVEKARQFCSEVKELASKYDLPFFIVTDGASATNNNDCEAVRNARENHKKWELLNNFDPNEDWSNDKKYHKLVRDKIPEIIKSNNEEPITKILNDVEYKQELERKLKEELNETLESIGNDRIEELADMLEVMINLAKLEEKDLDDIINVCDEKRKKRGGFEKRIYLSDVKK